MSVYEEVEEEGVKARLAGKSSNENPYNMSDVFFTLWHEGWMSTDLNLEKV